MVYKIITLREPTLLWRLREWELILRTRVQIPNEYEKINNAIR